MMFTSWTTLTLPISHGYRKELQPLPLSILQMLSTGNKKEQSWGGEKRAAFKQGETNIPKVNRVKLKYVCCTTCPCSGRMSYFTSIDNANTSSLPPLSSYEQNKLMWNMTQFYHLALKYCLQITRQQIFSGKDRSSYYFNNPSGQCGRNVHSPFTREMLLDTKNCIDCCKGNHRPSRIQLRRYRCVHSNNYFFL